MCVLSTARPQYKKTISTSHRPAWYEHSSHRAVPDAGKIVRASPTRGPGWCGSQVRYGRQEVGGRGRRRVDQPRRRRQAGRARVSQRGHALLRTLRQAPPTHQVARSPGIGWPGVPLHRGWREGLGTATSSGVEDPAAPTSTKHLHPMLYLTRCHATRHLTCTHHIEGLTRGRQARPWTTPVCVLLEEKQRLVPLQPG